MCKFKDSLGDRMKCYEAVTDIRLTRRMPVIVRLDLRSGHTFTRGFKRPFDEVFSQSMADTMKYLCENVQNCVFGYSESDEITLVLVDYKELETDVFFDNRVEKICSITAAMATFAFNRSFVKNASEWSAKMATKSEDEQAHSYFLAKAYHQAETRGAMFDSRCFNVPKDDVTNLVLWRQLDCARNSVQSAGQSVFPHKLLHGKSCSEIQDMLMTEKNINWNNYPTRFKRGIACIKLPAIGWKVDYEMPMLKGDSREYLEKLI